MTILLVGAGGQVGQEINELAKANNITLLALKRQQCDITDINAVQAVLNANQDISCVINAAAYTAVDLAEDEPEKAYAINADAVENLAIICKQYDIPLIHISTDYVFSGDKTEPYEEIDEPCPTGGYGASKLEGERIIQSIFDNYIILRVSWVFGQYGKNFVKTIVRLANEREQLSIVDDQIGNPTAAADIARVILQLVKEIHAGNLHRGIYHYCDTPAVSWFQFAEKIIANLPNHSEPVLKKLSPISSNQYPTKAARPMNSRLNCDKINSKFDIQQHDWMRYLKLTIEASNESSL